MVFNKNIISIITLTSILALTGVQANERHDSGNNIARMAKKLDLTTEQQASITAIMSDFKAQHSRPDRETMKAKAQEMKENFSVLMSSDTLDEATVIARLEQRAIKHNERKLEQVKLQHAIFQELTAEQQPIYLKVLEKKMRMKMKMKNSHGSHKHHDAQNNT